MIAWFCNKCGWAFDAPEQARFCPICGGDLSVGCSPVLAHEARATGYVTLEGIAADGTFFSVDKNPFDAGVALVCGEVEGIGLVRRMHAKTNVDMGAWVRSA